VARHPRRQIGLLRAAADQRGGHGAERSYREGTEAQLSCTNVSLNPSGSEIMNTRLPHSIIFGS